MNTRFTTTAAAVALALLGSSAAFAQTTARAPIGDEINGYAYAAPALHSTTTRAEVKAEVARAQAEGELFAGDEISGYAQPEAAHAVVTAKTRAEVKAELQAARRNGELDGLEFHS